MTRTEKFIQDNKRVLLCGRDYYNPDTSFMKREDFDRKKLKVLVVFPTPSDTKAVSTTKEALNDFVIEHCPDTFIDFCFIPNASDIKLFDKHAIPYAVGLITHLDASHYDIIGFSISVLSETITMASIINSFQRCDKPIDLTWSERKDKPIGEQPIIFCGGITAVCGDIMYGELGDGRQAFSDFTYLGECCKLDVVFRRYIEARSLGQVTRTPEDRYVYGYAEDPNEDKYAPLVENVCTNQEFIDSLFDLRCIYQPQSYEVIFNDKTQIISNKKINPKAQDWVKPLYPHKMSEDLGIGRAIINASGENCLVKGTLVPTLRGIKKIENLTTEDLLVGQRIGESFQELIKSEGEAVQVTTSSGVPLRATKEHRQYVLTNEGVREKYVGTLKVGDWILTRIGWNITPELRPARTTTNAYFAGLWYGDGYRGGGGTKWSEGDFYIAQSVAKHETAIIKNVLNSCYHEIESNTDSVRNFGLYKTDELAQFIYKTFPDYKNSIDSVLGWPLQDQVDFLRGLFDADGSSTKEGTVSIAMKRDRLQVLEAVQVMLNSFGIRTHKLPTKQVVKFGGEFYADEIKIVGKESYDNYFKYIGFSEPHKNKQKRGFSGGIKDSVPAILGPLMYGNLQNQGFRTNVWARQQGIHLSNFFNGKNGTTVKELLRLSEVYTDNILELYKSGFRFVRVVTIQDIGSHEVFDIKNVENHGFVAGTTFTHNCGTTQTQVSEGCSAAGCCSFCAEGNYTGGWCEKPREQILHEIREAKKYSAGYKYKPFSFNCNYVTDYKGMLYEFIQRYPKVTFINMRMEELGRDVDAIRMMKLIGSNRISAPMEGISPRIQNQLLNKCLSEQALNAFMDDMVHAKMGDIKVGGIFTGYEEDEDFQWICDFVDKFKKRAQQEGGNFPFRLKVTPLVHYNLTPCEYLERKSARKSYAGEHWLTDEWYEKFREHNVFFKVNGFRYSTFLEQSIIDLGRKATHIVYEEILKKGVEVYSLRSVAKPEIIQAFKDEINPDYFFEARDPEHYISLSHRIHIDLMGSYIPRARRLIRAYKAGDIFMNEEDIRCLKTYDGAPTKCYKMCAAKDPLKIYNDVEMDADGNLHGEYRLLLGCERCHDNEARKARLARPTPFTKNSNDILAAPRMKKTQRIRFAIKRDKEFDVLNPNNTAHTFIAKLLQRSDNLLDSYHSMNIHSMIWQSDPNIPYVASGLQLVDTIWTKPVYKEVLSLIVEVNADMKSVQIIKASEVFMDDKLDCNDFNIFRFETRLPYDLFATSAPSYKGEVKIKGDFEDTIKKDPLCKAPVFIQAGKVVGYFALPFKYNPILYMQQFLNAKKVTVNKIVQEIDFECIMQVRQNTNMVCKNCHSEQATVSLTTGKNFPFGTQCLCKALLSKEMQK